MEEDSVGSVALLTRVLENEKAAPELLRYERAVVESVRTQLARNSIMAHFM